MARTRNSPEYILPTRMTLHVPAETSLRFSVLDFPYKQAIKDFMTRFEKIYEHQRGKTLPYDLRLPYRQLNDAILTLAPGLIQAFEGAYEGDDFGRRMVAFTRFEDGHAEDFPRLDQLTALIRHWLERWADQPEVQAIIQGEGKAAWQALLDALRNSAETEWQHGIHPASLAADQGYEKGLAFLALPALITALLHDQAMTIQRPQGELPIIWRRAHDGGTRGLHVVSQPIPYQKDYFAYRLNFSVQTQAGYAGVWIFAHLSIQRYIGERYRNGDEKRAISILVGCNRERFSGGWDNHTTLIRLPVEKKHGDVRWESGVGRLLDDLAVRRLIAPEEILSKPRLYGSYENKPQGDEYYIVYAEGRKFGDERERGHQIKTGVSLRERSQIMEGVLSLLDGWLEVSAPFRKDMQNPKNTLALRDYDHMVKKRKNSTTEHASWRTALTTSLANSGDEHLHLVVLHRSPEFRERAQVQIEEALMGANSGDAPLVTVTFAVLPPLLYAPLDSGDLDPKAYFLPRDQKPEGWTMAKWAKQMRASYGKKRQEWHDFLSGIEWQPKARRLVLIDSTGERNIPHDQQIKGAIRDACNRENVQSQFIVGDALKLDRREAYKDELDGGSAGKLKNAVLDLLVRQQAIPYAPPGEIYTRAAKLDKAIANQLDIITFCRFQRTKFPKLYYVLAVRLRATGEVDVMLPSDTTHWIPYGLAASKLGVISSEERVTLANEHLTSQLRLGHKQMLNFVHEVLTQRLERQTIAVIEAEGWRNSGGKDRQNDCWTQLTNPSLFKYRDVLRFDNQRSYERAAPSLDRLLGVIRLRMNDETPQYITAEKWDAEDSMRDVPHLTGYVDPNVPELMHYMSVARLPEMQKKQNEPDVTEAFRPDIRANKFKDIAVKHAQLIELVPFFRHPDFQSDEGQRQLCRCVHFLRISPAFTSGEIALPYPMHLGEKLIKDQLVIIGADD